MGDKHYVSVTGIIIKNGKYLLTRRALTKKTFPGMWTVPGGNLEIEDYINKKKDTDIHWYNILERVLKREIMEETGLKVKNIGYVTSMTFMKGEEPMLVISLYGDYDSGEVRLDEESCDFAWVTLEEAKNYELIEGIYEELVMLDNFLNDKNKNIGEWKKGDEDGICT
jgi:8-oxo-dGTP pyrophosphatase MutT (NUDIX family)